MNKEEERIHCACVEWFDYQYPSLKYLLFHPANGGKRNIIEAKKFKRMGMRAGVADLIFTYPFIAIDANKNTIFQAGAAIEIKSKEGRQTKAQKEYEKSVIEHGYIYEIVRNFTQFEVIILKFMSNKNLFNNARK